MQRQIVEGNRRLVEIKNMGWDFFEEEEGEISYI